MQPLSTREWGWESKEDPSFQQAKGTYPQSKVIANGSFIMTLYCLPHSNATPLSTSPKSAQLRENKHKYNGPALGPWKLIYTLYSFYIYIHTHVHLRGNWQTWTRKIACHSSKQKMLPLILVNKDQAISHCSPISQTPCYSWGETGIEQALLCCRHVQAPGWTRLNNQPEPLRWGLKA